jgi:PAS domain S-box-containing protein
MNQQSRYKDYTFLKGTGKNGQLIRDIDWSAAGLAPISAWRQSLKSVVNIMLCSDLPMLLWWGKDLVQIYNDAFNPAFAVTDDHPHAMGRRGRESWRKQWAMLQPVVDKVMFSKDPTGLHNQTLPVFRDVIADGLYWSFSLSPVIDEDGATAGVLVTCRETMAHLNYLRELTEKKDRLLFAIDAAELGTWDFDPVTRSFTCNTRLKKWFGFSPSDMLNFEQAIKCVVDKDKAKVREFVQFILIDKADIIPELEYAIVDCSTGDERMLKVKSRRVDTPNGFRYNGTVQDVTAERTARQETKKAEMMAALALKSAGVGLFTYDLSTSEVSFSPEFLYIISGNYRQEHSKNAGILSQYIHPLDEPMRDAAFSTCIQTGEFCITPRVIWNDGTEHRVQIDGACVYNANKVALKITGTARDITDLRRKSLELKESEARFRNIFEQAPMAIGLLQGPDMIIQVANDRMLELWGKNDTVIGQSVAEALPEIEGQPFPWLLRQVYETGEPYQGTGMLIKLFRNDKMENVYVDFVYAPIRNDEGQITGIMTLATDVTERERYKLAIEQSENRLRAIISSAPAGIALFVGRDLVIEYANETFIKIVGKGPGVEGKPLREAMPELLTENQPFLTILDEVYSSGKMFQSYASQVKIMVDGVMTDNYYNITYTPIKDKNGEVFGILDIAIDVTNQVKAQQQLQETESTLRGAVELAGLGTWVMDVETNTITYSKRMQEWFGIDNETGSFEEKINIIVSEDRERVKAAIERALDPHLGGAYDTEYTIINQITGLRRILHALGRTVFDDWKRPVRINGASKDITLQKESLLALENEVQARTEELADSNEELAATNEELEKANNRLVHSNEELAQYAYVASHDLQEPLRKIRIYSGMLNEHKSLPAASMKMIEKITKSAERMSLLIRDLLEFSRLLKADTLVRPVNLRQTAEAVMHDFELSISEKNATVNIGELPIIEAVSLQMNQLFYNLLGNALKFARPGVAPIVNISSSALLSHEISQHFANPLAYSRYHRISVSDNGVGFEPEFSEQIFEIFKRLHGRDVIPGSGIGLALCKRIVETHHGSIYAESMPGHGSTFHIILPEKQQQ